MNPVDPADRRPPFRQIADRLREEIVTGVLSPNERLPSERRLAKDWGCAQATVRQAFGVLRAEGLIDAVQGLGHYVRGPRSVLHRRGGLSRFVVEAREQGHEARRLLADVTGPRRAPEEIAACLELDPEDEVIVRHHVMTLDGDVAELADSYFPYELIRDTAIARNEKPRGGAHAELQRLGFELHHFTENVTVRMPTPQEANALHLPTGVPVLCIRRMSFATGPEANTEPRPVVVTDYILAGDRHVLTYGIDAEKRWSEEDGRWLPRE